MSSPTDPRQTIDASADPATAKYASSLQEVPFATSSNIYITNINEYTTIRVSDPGQPSGNTSEVQFNLNGRMSADDGLTYNPTTDSLDVLGNLTAGTVFTDNLKYANGSNWTFSGSSYSNSNVQSYLPTYTGNLNVDKVVATLFAGSGANLTNIPAGNILGAVASATSATSATTATTAGSATTAVNVTSPAQPNITSVGTLSSLSVTATVTAGNLSSTGRVVATGNITSGNADLGNLATANYFSGNASQLFSLPGANVTGTVPSATSAGSATTAGTVTTAAQPNITSVGTLTGLTVSNSSGIVNFNNTANVSLGSIANLKIGGGGTNGQVLTATGSGNTVQWSTPTAGNLQDITTNGANTDRAIFISNTTSSTNANTGALKVTGGVGISGNLHVQNPITSYSTIYAGSLSDFGSWTVPVFLGRDAGAEYIQGALVNTNANGSADWVAYNDLSDGDGGMSAWADMGYTGSTFSDPLYTITNANDGYFFVQGIDALDGGNLVIATGEKGTHHDIVFATGGFLEQNETMRLDHERNIFFVGGHAHTGLSDKIIDLDVNGNTAIGGNTSVTGNLTVTKMMVSVTNTLGNLTATAGARAFVSDANLVALGNFGAQIGGGGSNLVPAWSDGTNWYVG